MIIPVLGMDPSLTNWGLASANLDLETGYLSTPHVQLVSPDKIKGKQVRVNSEDLHRSEQLAQAVFAAAKTPKAVFVEVPVGSQSARAMASYGICIGILGALRAKGIPIIEVTPTEVKVAYTGNKNATKDQMIEQSLALYPEVNFPMFKGKPAQKAEHLADAIATIHAGVHTPAFQTILRFYKDTQNS